MQNYKQYFKGKKITCMGLGLLGRGVGDALFLLECGAELTITDLKTSEQLKDSVSKFKKYSNVRFVLGEHRLEDFRDRDMILKSAGVPFDSVYIEEAKKNNIPIEMSASLFAKLSGVPVIGTTGTRGKSTVTYMIEHLLKIAGKKVLLGGNVRGVSTLSLLKKAKGMDYAVFELDSWQLQGFGDSKISPHISIFTTFYSDHLNYYKNDLEHYFSDKANIFTNQKSQDFFIAGAQAWPTIKKYTDKNDFKYKSKVIVPAGKLPKGFSLNIPGAHNQYNAMLTLTVAKCLNIPDLKIKKALKSFKPVEGRLEYIKTVKGIKIYNDNNSTTPEATMVALKALGTKQKNITLIMGGADKKLDMSSLLIEIKKYCKNIILLPGTGSDNLNIEKAIKVSNLKEAIKQAVTVSKKGDTILFSPAFASFGLFVNEYERNDQFLKIVKSLK